MGVWEYGGVEVRIFLLSLLLRTHNSSTHYLSLNLVAAFLLRYPDTPTLRYMPLARAKKRLDIIQPFVSM
jgi:hypothetical protein